MKAALAKVIYGNEVPPPTCILSGSYKVYLLITRCKPLLISEVASVLVSSSVAGACVMSIVNADNWLTLLSLGSYITIS